MNKCPNFVTLANTDKKELRDNLKLGRKTDREQFEPFIGKKVTIETTAKYTIDGKTTTNMLEGKIIERDKDIVFMRKGQRSHCKLVTAGLFDGWYATLTVRKIKEKC